MSIYTNGNKVAYLDGELSAGVVFCTQQGRVVAVTPEWVEAIHIIDKGLQFCIRQQQQHGDGPRHGHIKQQRDEFIRKAASKYPMAYIF